MTSVTLLISPFAASRTPSRSSAAGALEIKAFVEGALEAAIRQGMARNSGASAWDGPFTVLADVIRLRFPKSPDHECALDAVTEIVSDWQATG